MARWDAFFDRDLRRVPDVSDLKRGAFFFVDFPEILPAKMQACILEKPFSLNSGNGSTPKRFAAAGLATVETTKSVTSRAGISSWP